MIEQSFFVWLFKFRKLVYMKILSVNAGSSSVKFKLFDMPKGDVLVAARYERIGLDNSIYTINYNSEKIVKQVVLKDHSDALKSFLKELVDMKVILNYNEIEGIGHRVVQGGDKYFCSVLIDEKVINDIESFVSLAPLHNPANLLGIKVVKGILPDSKNVAVFDTAFHQTISQEQHVYPLPYEWYEQYKVRKYGFHGISHQYLADKICEIVGNDNLKIITCHLGNGVSISAIKDKKSIANSLGFTPLSGVMMGTRCGDIDPTIIPYIMKNANKTIDEVMYDLNNKSGFLGVSGLSSDSRDIINGIEHDNKRCLLAEKMFVERVVSYISYYYTLLNKADVIVFSAGIGEMTPKIRKDIIDRLNCLGIYVDEKANEIRGELKKISSENSSVLCYVIPTDEELMIAKETYELIER